MFADKPISCDHEGHRRNIGLFMLYWKSRLLHIIVNVIICLLAEIFILITRHLTNRKSLHLQNILKLYITILRWYNLQYDKKTFSMPSFCFCKDKSKADRSLKHRKLWKQTRVLNIVFTRKPLCFKGLSCHNDKHIETQIPF